MKCVEADKRNHLLLSPRVYEREEKRSEGNAKEKRLGGVKYREVK